MNVKKILILIPAFNEQGNIQKVIQEIYSLNLASCFDSVSISVLVVNDGSEDSTAQEAKKAEALVISLPYNLGIGGAVQTGFKFANSNGYDIIARVDGDGQHDVNYIKELVDPVLKGKIDLAIGSRFLPPHLGYLSSFVRRIGIKFFSFLLSFLTEYKITDPTSGFRVYNKKMINLFADYYPQDFPEPEEIVVAGRVKARIIEIPIKMRKRISGNSSIRYLKTLYYMLKVTFAIILDKLK